MAAPGGDCPAWLYCIRIVKTTAQTLPAAIPRGEIVALRRSYSLDLRHNPAKASTPGPGVVKTARMKARLAVDNPAFTGEADPVASFSCTRTRKRRLRRRGP